MFDLIAFVKPVLDELTGQDIRAWSDGSRIVRANWQIPDPESRTWEGRTLQIEFAQDILQRWADCDRSSLCQQQRALDRILRARLGTLTQRGRTDGVIVVVVDTLLPA